MRVTIDKELCTGCGLCTDNCPEVFEMKDDVAVAKMPDVDDSNKELIEKVKNAASDCPAEAIKT